jgi:hypothetical protein
MEILIAIVTALLGGLFKIIGISMDNSAKSDAEASKKETVAVLDVVDSEKKIRDSGREVERAGLRYEDVFVPRSGSV